MKPVATWASDFKADYQPSVVSEFLAQLGHLEAGGCTEIRILSPGRSLKLNGTQRYVGAVISGYFNDYERAAREIAPFDGQAAVYCSLQPCDPKLLRRSDNHLTLEAKHTTNDSQIVAYNWLLLDIDPVRPAETASSDHELQLSADLLLKMEQECLSPLEIQTAKGISGNGVHGLIRISSQLAVDKTQPLVKEILETLADRFDTDQVKVDTSVFNPSRISKVYGTMAIKKVITHQKRPTVGRYG